MTDPVRSLLIDDAHVSSLADRPGSDGPPTVDLAGAELAWCWPRPLDPDVGRAARRILTGPWFSARATLCGDGSGRGVDDLLADAGLAGRPGFGRLAADVVRLAGLLARAAGCAEVAVRLEHDPGSTCPVFHQDHNVMRLLCTYAGPGTEWLPEDHVDRDQLGLRGRTPNQANRAIAIGPVRSTRPGEVLVARGARFGPDGRGLVHRSPAPARGPRLLLVVDPI